MFKFNKKGTRAVHKRSGKSHRTTKGTRKALKSRKPRKR